MCFNDVRVVCVKYNNNYFKDTRGHFINVQRVVNIASCFETKKINNNIRFSITVWEYFEKLKLIRSL